MNLPMMQKKIRDFISKLTATGGGDAPEDIAGALELCIQQDWQARTKVAFLIGDDPCHGTKFHTCADDYPTMHPDRKRSINFNGSNICKKHRLYIHTHQKYNR